MEGAKIIRNIALMGTFWTGVVLLVTEAKANIYESEGKPVSVSSGMNPGTVPQAEINVAPGEAVAEDGGNANSGGVQVQNVTVQAGAAASAESQTSNTNSNSNALDAINRVRTDAETSNNALLLQQIELNRLKAEQSRIKAINEFGSNLDAPAVLPAPPAGPCGLNPCMPPAAAPLIENNNSNVIVNSKHDADSVETVIEADNSPSFFTGSKWGISPLLGMRFYSDDTLADVTNNYILGVGVDADLGKWLSAEGSFTYGTDKLEGFSSPGGWGIWNETERQTYELGMGIKVGPRMQSLRPYLALGLGFINQQYGNIMGRDYSTNSFTGNIGGGVDFKLAKNFSVGARADYKTVFGGSGDEMVYGAYGKTLNDLYGDQGDRYSIGATGTVSF